MSRQALLPGLAVALVAVFLPAAATAEHRLGAAQLRDDAIARVLTAPDAVMLTRAKTGGTVNVVMSRRDRTLVFSTAGLPPLASGRCYQSVADEPVGRPVRRNAPGRPRRNDEPGDRLRAGRR